MALEFRKSQRNIPAVKILIISLATLISSHIAGAGNLVTVGVAAWLERHPDAIAEP